MISSNRFGAALGRCLFDITVEKGERIRVTADDPDTLMSVSWYQEGEEGDAGGTGYGEITGGVFTPGDYTLSVTASGPGTAVVEEDPPLPV